MKGHINRSKLVLEGIATVAAMLPLIFGRGNWRFETRCLCWQLKLYVWSAFHHWNMNRFVNRLLGNVNGTGKYKFI